MARQCPKSLDTRREGGQVLGTLTRALYPEKTGVMLSRVGSRKVRACDGEDDTVL